MEWLQEVTISLHIPQYFLVSSPGLGSDDCLSGEELESLCHGHGACDDDGDDRCDDRCNDRGDEDDDGDGTNADDDDEEEDDDYDSDYDDPQCK